MATKPRAGSSAGDFNERCAADETCAGGIYTAETYDAVMMIGAAANMENGANMASHLNMVGVDYAGASGSHTFLHNGDVAGAGYDICEFVALSSSDIYFNCMEWWSAIDGIQASEFNGATVKIGFLNPMTGPIAVYAPGFGAAATIALGMMNAAGWSNGLQFELVMADSGCSGDVAATGAQTLIDAGVVGVVGAACSGATMAANAVLSAAGIPMISYASTNPGLSDAEAYPHFFRVVPSDALQGPALNAVVAADGGSDVALMYMTNDYGSGFADAFAAAHGSDNLCASIGYEETTTDFTSQVQQVIDGNCGSVVLISYAADGAAIVEELAAQSFSGQIFGGDGVAEEGLCASMASVDTCAGIVATKPASATPNERSMAFNAVCGAIPDCAGGIYTGEAFDAMIIMGFAVFAGASSPEGTPLSMLISAVGQGFVGASGVHTFGANGDVGGNGYCVGDFTVTEGTASFDCNRHADVAADGTTTIS
jgi:branched-chain amino acid transport system substrate-binding protein